MLNDLLTRAVSPSEGTNLECRVRLAETRPIPVRAAVSAMSLRASGAAADDASLTKTAEHTAGEAVPLLGSKRVLSSSSSSASTDRPSPAWVLAAAVVGLTALGSAASLALLGLHQAQPWLWATWVVQIMIVAIIPCA